ncbi:MAG: hypothetical protein FWG43_02320 [Clostridiales bacterium]|nr:hypothetical protein [Clostridiales bacterium]
MARCRCTDIANANKDLETFASIRDYIGEATKCSWLDASNAFDRLTKNITNGATPNNVFLFQNIKDKLEKPVTDRLKALADRCVSKLGVIPGQIQSMNTEDKSYHLANGKN